MERARRVTVLFAAGALLLAACGSSGGDDDASGTKDETTTTEAASSGGDATTTTAGGEDAAPDPPDKAFPKALTPAETAYAADEAEDFTFFNGETPGKPTPAIDYVQVWAGTATLAAGDVQALDAEVGCGTGKELVVCGSPVPAAEAGDYVVVTARLVDLAHIKATAGETGRYTLLVDAGGDDATKAKASDQAPDLAADGTNVTLEVVFGQQGAPPVQFVAVTPDGAFSQAGRIWIRANLVTWIAPTALVGTDVSGVRVSSVWGDAANTADASVNAADVAPGGKHAPFDLLEVPS